MVSMPMPTRGESPCYLLTPTQGGGMHVLFPLLMGLLLIWLLPLLVLQLGGGGFSSGGHQCRGGEGGWSPEQSNLSFHPGATFQCSAL
jgi:hypothetical protein